MADLLRPRTARLLALAAALAVLPSAAPAATTALPAPAPAYGSRPPAGALCAPEAWPLPVDGALCEAARLLAASLAGERGRDDDAVRARQATFFLRRQGVADAQVRTRILRGAHLGRLYARLEALAADPEATHVGVGLSPDGEEMTAVLFLARRLVALDPLPRAPAPHSILVLSGHLAPGTRRPQAWLGLPSGEVRAIPLTPDGRRLQGAVALDGPGRYMVEILVDAGEGPEAAVLAPLDVGTAPPPAPPPAVGDGPGDPTARVHQALADLRRDAARAPARRDADLDALALRKAEAVAERGRPVHRPGPDTEARVRLARAGWPFAWAAEDLAQGPSVRAAFDALLESPAHRRLLLGPRVRRVGVGVVRREGAVYLALLLAEPMAAPAAVRTAAAARAVEARLVYRAEDALREARRGRRLPPALRDPDLDALAARHARRLAEADRAEDPDAAAALRTAATRRDPLAQGAALDVVVAGRPEDAARAPNASGRGCDRLGLGIARADSRRFGGQRFWIVALCVDRGGTP